MKCYDGKEILMNKFNEVYSYSSPLSNYDTLVSDLDLIGTYKINGLVRYGVSGPTNFEHATGIDAISMYGTYTQDTPRIIQLTKNYAIEICVLKRDVESYFEYSIRVRILNTLNNNILKSDGFICQRSDKINVLPYLLFAIQM